MLVETTAIFQLQSKSTSQVTVLLLDSEFRFMFERKELTEGAKMLLLVDGVFVRGYVQSFQDPDL